MDPRGPALDAPLVGIDAAVASRVEAARRNVVANPRDPGAWTELALTCEANELFGPALDAYGKLQLMQPREARWWYRAAVVEDERGGAPSAVLAMQRAIELGFEEACAFWRLGSFQLEGGDAAAARASFERATRTDADDAAGWIGLGRTHLQRDEYDAAARAFEEALRRAPGDRYARGLLGSAYRALGRWDDAQPHLLAGLSVGPHYPDRCDTEVRARAADSARARLENAKDLLQAGRATQALPLLEGLAAMRPDDVSVHHLLAFAYEGAKRLAAARATWEKCLELEPDNLWTLVNAAVLLGRLGELEQAIATCDRAIAVNPTFGAAYEIKGGLLLAMDRKAEAALAYRSGMRYDQRNRSVPLRVARIELALGRPAEAAELLEPLARDASPPREVLECLAEAYEGLGRTDEARATRARAAGSGE